MTTYYRLRGEATDKELAAAWAGAEAAAWAAAEAARAKQNRRLVAMLARGWES